MNKLSLKDSLYYTGSGAFMAPGFGMENKSGSGIQDKYTYHFPRS